MNAAAHKLTKLKCIEAIDKWNDEIVQATTANDIANYIPTLSSFQINRATYDEFISESDDDRFHIYPGIDSNNDLLMILVPLDSNGLEKDLTHYSVGYYSNLTTDVFLEESSITKTTNWIKFSDSFQIADSSSISYTLSPTFPAKNINVAVQNIIAWNNSYLDWFEIMIQLGGTGIFRAFSTNVNDLKLEFTRSHVDLVYCFFGLESNPLIQNSLPNLIFVSDASQAEIIADSQQINEHDILSNSYDFGTPCPPICGGAVFSLLSS